ncbi:hypothetical protein IGB42_04109 [Andreprevotia sp. IGB-42]|uniref:substrate-binding periplasmic protein n=1 Tax=Andreprevotia sp. IGB-42 TaxID=2497473 RepID=UPI00135932C8|nr:transporter substrate-binding domain-containing protein [Andreprevotia sp. IGB-42]KAF0811411.1 hypothetical protein IGB42_04109 [Andreprevotia sp. IGB-42]
MRGFLWLVLLLCCCNPARAGAALNALLIDVEPLVLPHNQGYGRDFFDALAAETGLQFAMRTMPSARVNAELARGEPQVALSTSQTEISADLQRIAPVIEINLLILPAKALRARTLADFSGLQVGRIRSGCMAVLQLPEINLYDLNDLEQGMRMLQAGRLDGLCGNTTSLGWQLKKAGLTWHDFPPVVSVRKQDLWLVASRAVPPATIQRLRTGVEAMMRKGRIKALHDKYHMGMDEK